MLLAQQLQPPNTKDKFASNFPLRATASSSACTSHCISLCILRGKGLRKPKYFVITVDGEQTKTTKPAPFTQNPEWKERFDLHITQNSLLTIQLFDQNTFIQASDQGFLGAVHIAVSQAIDLNNDQAETTLSLPLSTTDRSLLAQGSLDLSLTITNSPCSPTTAAVNKQRPSSEMKEDSAAIQRRLSNSSFQLLHSTDAGEGPLPAGWEERELCLQQPDGTEVKRRYYVDHNSKSTSWVDPRRTQQLLLRTDSADASQFESKSITLTQLGPLPPGWEMRINDKGRLFFIDHRAKRLTWEDPRLSTDPSLPQYKRDFKQKQIYFRSLSFLKPEAGKTAIPITRSKVLSDAFYQVMKKTPLQLKKKLVIKFDGEDGLDYGGLSREFFFLLSQSLFDPAYGLFQYCSPTNYLLQICPNSAVNPEHLHYFRFVGRVLGLAIFHSRFLDAFFTPSFYKALLKKKISLADLQGVDRESFNSLTWILQHELAQQEAHLEMYFTADDECMGEVKTHELTAGGKQILITDENKHEYVEAYCKWKLYLRVKEQFDAIRHGLYEIIPYEALVMFDEKEMELLLGGLKEINLEDWQRHTEYKRYRVTDKQVQWFWQVVQDYDTEKRMRLLQFVTGTSRLPIGGFRELHGSDGPRRFTLERTGTVDSLPKSHTCFNRLDLPAYASYAQLHSKLTYAIEETVGFATE